jgi:3-ketosteroid 9alpha-monooxygenase subunit A
MSRFPFPLPTGWFMIRFSSELEVGQVVPVRYFARDMVLFRTSDGKAHLLDAFCPHLGAHLGYGGKLEDDKLVCPFHAWQFHGDGTCAHIPYATKQPRNADVAAWPIDERNGMIMAWHDLAGRPPQWSLPDVAEYLDPGWTPYRTKAWTIRTCNQEMAENQVDAAHFRYLHGTAEMPVTTSRQEGHRLISTSTTKLSTPMGPVDGMIEVNAYGFGFTTTRFTGLVETLLVSSSTPIDEERCEISFAFTVRDIGKGITGGVGKAFMAEISRQLEQDIPVWENKAYLRRPVLCDGDGPIGLFRTWSRQFYPSDESAAQGA